MRISLLIGLTILLQAGTIARAQQVPAAPAPVNIFPEGSFDIVKDNGQPEGWKLPDKNYIAQFGATAALVREGENRYLRITNGDLTRSIWADASIGLDASWKELKVSLKMRVSDLKLNPEKGWFSAQWDAQWKGEDGKYLKHVGTEIRLKSATEGWVEKEQTLLIPAGAKTLAMNPGLWGATGTLDLDDLRIYAR